MPRLCQSVTAATSQLTLYRSSIPILKKGAMHGEYTFYESCSEQVVHNKSYTFLVVYYALQDLHSMDYYNPGICAILRVGTCFQNPKIWCKTWDYVSSLSIHLHYLGIAQFGSTITTYAYTICELWPCMSQLTPSDLLWASSWDWIPQLVASYSLDNVQESEQNVNCRLL